MKDSKIEWCHHTFNPWIGCTKISPACDHCYAEQIAGRFGMAQWGNSPRKLTGPQNWKQPVHWNRQARIKEDAWNNFIAQNPGLTDGQLIEKGFIKSERPRVFCGSMCDIFDNQILPAYRLRLFQLIYETPHLDWLLLTKRIGNAESMLREAKEFYQFTDSDLKNVWIGAMVCNQQEAERDIPKLLSVSATKRFLSIEPMLGPIALSFWIERIDWVIVGGESGPKARPMHPDGPRSLRDQCKAAGVPFFFKQWGAWATVYDRDRDDPDWRNCPKPKNNSERYLNINGGHGFHGERVVFCRRFSKDKAGCLLDGVEHKEVPV